MCLVDDVVGYLGDDPCVHAVEGALERCVLEYHRFKRNIARALAYAEQ